MADELCARLTGRQVVDGIDIEVGLVITDDALFGGDSRAADPEDYGPIPAETARDLLRRAARTLKTRTAPRTSRLMLARRTNRPTPTRQTSRPSRAVTLSQAELDYQTDPELRELLTKAAESPTVRTLRTLEGTRFFIPVPGHNPDKVFWSGTDKGCRTEAVPRP